MIETIKAPAGSDTQATLGLRSGLLALLIPRRLVFAIVLLGFALRFYQYDALSLWLDEGITVYVTRMPWDTVLGFHGAYETHPPLYFILVKLFTLVVPEVNAGRLVSVLAGTLTIPVLYALAARLTTRWAGVVAALTLAVSPLHIWFSQEGRMYSLTVLLVAVSYLALVGFYRSPRWSWAVLYGASVLVAMYVNYGSLYALLPQVVLLALFVKKHGRSALKLWVALIVAVVGYLPWLPQLITTMQTWGDARAGYLGVSQGRVAFSVLSVTGAGGNALTTSIPNGGYYWGSEGMVRDYGLIAQLAIVAIISVVAIIGSFNLARRYRLALLVAWLSIATILVTLLMSQISPGFAERTILPSLIGWTILVGGATLDVPKSKIQNPKSIWLRWLGIGAVVGVIMASLISLRAMYAGGVKQEWRLLAEATMAASSTGHPIITYPTLTEPLIDVYEPEALGEKHIHIRDGQPLPPSQHSALSTQHSEAVWLAYLEHTGIGTIRSQLEELGYERRIHKGYYHPLFLDLYARPGAKVPEVALPKDITEGLELNAEWGQVDK